MGLVYNPLTGRYEDDEFNRGPGPAPDLWTGLLSQYLYERGGSPPVSGPYTPESPGPGWPPTPVSPDVPAPMLSKPTTTPITPRPYTPEMPGPGWPPYPPPEDTIQPIEAIPPIAPMPPFQKKLPPTTPGRRPTGPYTPEMGWPGYPAFPGDAREATTHDAFTGDQQARAAKRQSLSLLDLATMSMATRGAPRR